MNMKKRFVLACLMIFSMGAAQAQEFVFDIKQLYVGGGFGFNSPDFGDSAIGLHGFAGYELTDLVVLGDDKVGLYAEAGLAHSGKFESCFANLCGGPSLFGLWGNGVIDYQIVDRISVLGRLGLEIGDDTTFIIGGGGEYQINEKISARAEFIIRDFYTSLQLNGIYHF